MSLPVEKNGRTAPMRKSLRMGCPTPGTKPPVTKTPSVTPASIDHRRGSFLATLQNLERPSVGLVLFLVGLQLMYFLPLLVPASRETGAALYTYRYHFAARLLILAGAFLEAKAGGFWLLKRHQAWVGWGLAALVITTTISLFDGASLLDILVRQQGFFWMLLAPGIALRARNWPWVLLTLAGHAVFGAIYTVYEIFILGHSTRLSLIVQNDTYQFFGQSLYMDAFLLLLIPSFTGKWLRGIAVTAFISQVIQSFFAAKRYPLLIAPVEMLLLIYVLSRTNRLRKSLSRWLSAAALIFLVWQVAGGATQGIASMFQEGNEQVMTRMTQKGSIGATIAEDERWHETQAAIDSMTWTNWLVGKGVASTSFTPGMIVAGGIHNSVVNLFYWGGIPLFLMVMTPLAWIIGVVRRSPDPVGIGCAAFMLIAYLNFPAYTIYTDCMLWLLFCVAMGPCAWNEALLSSSTRSAPARGPSSSLQGLSPAGRFKG